MAKAPPKRDLSAEWFSALEEAGYSYDFRFFFRREGMGEPLVYPLSHQKFDGLGAMAHLLQQRGDPPIAMPNNPEKRPSWWALLVTMIALTFRRRPRLARFANVDQAREAEKAPQPGDGAKDSFALRFFTRAETKRFRDIAKANGVSVNSWLLWALTQATREHLRRASGDVEWIIPVNMRGAVPVERDTDNQAFSIEIAFPPEATPAELHAAVQTGLARKVHWLGPMLLPLFQWMRPSRLRDLAVRAAKIPKTGCFSNMGAVAPIGEPPGGDAGAPEEWWCASNPVFAARPIGVVALTWRGCLALSMNIHSSLRAVSGDAEAWLSSMRAFASGERGSGTAEPPRGGDAV